MSRGKLGSCPKVPFEKFEEKSSGRGRQNTEPKISLRKSGSLGINRPALEEFFSDAEAIVFYYDEEENQVGMRPVEDADTEDSSYKITVSNGSGSVTPGSFLRSNDLIPEVTTRYEPFSTDLNGDVELVAVDLDEPVGTYGSADNEDGEDSGDES